MGQSSAKQRLHVIKTNVLQITENMQSNLPPHEIEKSHDILLDYQKELGYILSRSISASRIRKVERLIGAALNDLATLEGNSKTIEPRLKAKSMLTLANIEKDIKTISNNLTKPSFETEKEMISDYKKRLSLIDDVDHDIGVKKTQLLGAMNSVENVLSEKEIEEKLKQAEEKHYELGFFENEILKLRSEVAEIAEVSDKIKKRKDYLLYNIENNLLALEVKNKTGLLNDVIVAYNNFEKINLSDCNSDELSGIYNKLSSLQIKIEKKLNLLRNQEEIEVEVNNEIYEVSPHRDKLKEIENCVKNIQTQIQNFSYSKDSNTYINSFQLLQQYKAEAISLSEKDKNHSEVLDFIDKVLVLLDKNISRNSTTGNALLDVMSIKTNVDKLGTKIKNPNNTSEDYNLIKSELLECLEDLKRLELPHTRSKVCEVRDFLFMQIENYLSYLAKKQ